jgi:hypothetical protein
MLDRQLYYKFKPFVPRRLRIALRRVMARYQRRRHAHDWPICESAATPPPGWPGWPDGRRFAVVLTHDVEGPEGLARCRELAALETQLGFRSAFNFIPEGPYVTPPELREELNRGGFEVGVHDLRHDGKLYASREDFRHNAQRINRHLHDWNAVGFRAGFMLHNRSWLHDLEVEYDASTFDVDPFEPQPEGVNSIFPLWEAPAGGDGREGALRDSPGYVELPYTLPQDSTLYLILEESDDSIWRRKVDWIAERGGMALINVHPDYLSVHARGTGPAANVLQHYTAWLRHLNERHRGAFWNALPREVARHVRPHLRPLPHQP